MANTTSTGSMQKPRLALAAALVALTAATACTRPTQAQTPVAPAATQSEKAPVTDATPVEVNRLVVYKSPSCGCCVAWVDHMRAEGFIVDVHEQNDVTPVKEMVGVPYGKGSCHTAEIGGYFIEGHVPAADVKRLLAEKPDAKGLVLPGMPAGSPGMEMPDGSTEPYTVELVGRDGSTTAYAAH